MLSGAKEDKTLEDVRNAIKYNNLDEIKKYIEEPSIIEIMKQQDKVNSSLIVYAVNAQRYDYNIAMLLIKAGLDINATNEQKQTVIQALTDEGINRYNVALVKELLSHNDIKTSINNKNPETGITPLLSLLMQVRKIYEDDMYISESRSLDDYKKSFLELITAFLKQGAEVNMFDNMGYSPLSLAIEINDKEILDLILSQPNINKSVNSDITIPTNIQLRSWNHQGEKTYYINKPTSSLQLAIEKGNISVIKKLLEMGADVNKELKPISLEEKKYSYQLPLNQQPSDIQKVFRTQEVESILYKAFRNHNLKQGEEIVELLLEKGTHIPTIIKDKSLLMLAVENGWLKLTAQFLAQKNMSESIATRDTNGKNVLHHCFDLPFDENMIKIANILLSHDQIKQSINQKNNLDGSTPLLGAMKSFAYWHATVRDEKTRFEQAKNFAEFIQYLLKNGADPTATDNYDNNLFSYALQIGNKDIISIVEALPNINKVKELKPDDEQTIRYVPAKRFEGYDFVNPTIKLHTLSPEERHAKEYQMKMSLDSFQKTHPVVAQKVELKHLGDREKGTLYSQARINKILSDLDEYEKTTSQKVQKIRKASFRKANAKRPEETLTPLEASLNLEYSVLLCQDKTGARVPVTLYRGGEGHLLGTSGDDRYSTKHTYTRVKIGYDEINKVWVAVKIQSISRRIRADEKKALQQEISDEIKAGYELNAIRADITRDDPYRSAKIYQIQEVLGKCLEEDSDKRGTINDSDLALRIALDMIDEVEKLHKHNIIHGDIKPQNFMYNEMTKVLKLIDFGSHYRLPSGEDSVKVKRYKNLTPGYLAPEVGADECYGYTVPARIGQDGSSYYQFSKKTDIYALGKSIKMILQQSGIGYTELEEFAVSIIAGMTDKDPEKRWTLSQARNALNELIMKKAEIHKEKKETSNIQQESSQDLKETTTKNQAENTGEHKKINP